MTDDTIYVDLVKRDGTVVGRTLIDAADAEYVNSYRWRVNADGYAVRDARVGEGVGKRVISLAKALMDVAPRDSRQVDHINRDRLDNRRSNLRVCTHAQNHQNVPGHPRSTSRFRGVSWDSARQRWAAYVMLAGRTHHLGRFERETEAAEVAAAFRREHMPFAEETAV